MSLGTYAGKVVATVVVAKDGTGDYTTIQEGINALPSGGGVVYVKEGTYQETITISISNTSLIGSGKSTLIEGAGLPNGVIKIDGSYCFVDKLYIKNTAGCPKPGKGIIINGNNNLISNCWIENCSTHLEVAGGNNLFNKIFIITGITCQLGAISYGGGVVVNSDNNIFNLISFTSSDGFYIIGNNNIVSNCNILKEAFYVQGNNNIFENNNINEGFVNKYVIQIDGSYNRINNNQVNITVEPSFSSSYDVIQIDNSKNIVSHNLLRYDLTYNDFVNSFIGVSGNDNIIVGNSIFDNGGIFVNEGINIKTGSNNCIVSSNRVNLPSSTNQILDNGTGTTLGLNNTN